MAKTEITKQQFKAYLQVQMSGITNMFDLRNVTALTGLDKNQCMAIMKNYTELYKKYINELKRYYKKQDARQRQRSTPSSGTWRWMAENE